MSFTAHIAQGQATIKNGKIERVSSNDKLVQDSLKITITGRGDNPHHPSYGSKISKNLIGAISDPSFIASAIQNSIKDALENIQKKQRNQIQYQKLSPGEILAAIQDIKVEINQVDPRYVSVFVSILDGNLKNNNLNFDLEL